MAGKDGGCLNLETHCRQFPRPCLDTLTPHPHHFLQQFWVLFHEGFKCLSRLPPCPKLIQKRLRFVAILTLGKSWKSTVLATLNMEDEGRKKAFLSLPFHWIALGRSLRLKDTRESRLPASSESGKSNVVSVFKVFFLKKTFCGGLMQCISYCNKFSKFKYSSYILLTMYVLVWVFFEKGNNLR